jgi:hypothetical protein
MIISPYLTPFACQIVQNFNGHPWAIMGLRRKGFSCMLALQNIPDLITELSP